MFEKIIFLWGMCGIVVLLAVWAKALWVVGDPSVGVAVIGADSQKTKVLIDSHR